MIPLQGLIAEIITVVGLVILWPPKKIWWILAALFVVNLVFCRTLSTHIREGGDPRGFLIPINLIQWGMIIATVMALVRKAN